MSAQSKTRPRWLWGSVWKGNFNYIWKCPRKSNAKYPHPPVYLPEIPSSNSRFAAQQPRAVIFICAGRTPAESPAKWRRWRGNIFCTESMDDQSGAFTTHWRLHGRSLKRSAPRNTHTRLFIESSPASRPFGAATAHAKDARPGEKEKARKGHLFPDPCCCVRAARSQGLGHDSDARRVERR